MAIYKEFVKALGPWWTFGGAVISIHTFLINFWIPYWLALWMNNLDGSQYQFFFNGYMIIGAIGIIGNCYNF
jgi:hypothetical protein